MARSDLTGLSLTFAEKRYMVEVSSYDHPERQPGMHRLSEAVQVVLDKLGVDTIDEAVNNLLRRQAI